ncbi:hypothetical protein B484DRAFT_417597 [Ochromonadaceae sp. CCMP2298]|nr:hypothetical protein B484DRAFT_417597 [Ochromonadaceae sp. CCMP2298]
MKVDFTPAEALTQPRKKVARFAPNPEANWGPKRRAGRGGGDRGEGEGGEGGDEPEAKRAKT